MRSDSAGTPSERVLSPDGLVGKHHGRAHQGGLALAQTHGERHGRGDGRAPVAFLTGDEVQPQRGGPGHPAEQRVPGRDPAERHRVVARCGVQERRDARRACARSR
jgi:hypothetical protein